MTELTPTKTTNRGRNGRQPEPMSNTDHAVYATRQRLKKANTASMRMVIAALAAVSVFAAAGHPSLEFVDVQLQAVAVIIGIFAGFNCWFLTIHTMDAEQILNTIPVSRRPDDLDEVVEVSALFPRPKQDL